MPGDRTTVNRSEHHLETPRDPDFDRQIRERSWRDQTATGRDRAADSVVRESIKRHYENLERLAAGLRKLGMDDSTVDENITQVFHEYERELVNYMTAK